MGIAARLLLSVPLLVPTVQLFPSLAPLPQVVVTFCVLNQEDVLRFCYFVMNGGGTVSFSGSSGDPDTTTRVVHGRDLGQFVGACHGGTDTVSQCSKVSMTLRTCSAVQCCIMHIVHTGVWQFIHSH